MIYTTLLSCFKDGDYKQHEILTKTTQVKTVTYNSVKNTKKDKTSLKFVEIVHTLRQELGNKQIADFQKVREPLSKIVTHMKTQKATHSKLGLLNCIRNLFSRLQNKLNGYGFKTSLEIANDLLKELAPLPEAHDYETLVQQLKKHSNLDKIVLDKFEKADDINTNAFTEGTLLHAMLYNSGSVYPFCISSLVKLGADVNLLDAWKQTPLRTALSKELPFEIVKLLINSKTAQIKDDRRQTPRQFLESRIDWYRGARSIEKDQIIEALKAAEGDQEKEIPPASQTSQTTPNPLPLSMEQQTEPNVNNERPKDNASKVAPKPAEDVNVDQMVEEISDMLPFYTEHKNITTSDLQKQNYREEILLKIPSAAGSPVKLETPAPSAVAAPVEPVDEEAEFEKMKKLLPFYVPKTSLSNFTQEAREETLRYLPLCITENRKEHLMKMEDGFKWLDYLLKKGININAPKEEETILSRTLFSFYANEYTIKLDKKDQIEFIKKLFDNAAIPTNKTLDTVAIYCQIPEVLDLVFKDVVLDETRQKELINSAGIFNNVPAQEFLKKKAAATSPVKLETPAPSAVAAPVAKPADEEAILKEMQKSLPWYAKAKNISLTNFTNEAKEDLLRLLPICVVDNDNVMKMEDGLKWLDYLLTKGGFNINAVDSLEDTVLDKTIFNFYSDPEKELEEKDQIVFIRKLMKSGVTPTKKTLNYAVRDCKIPAVLELILEDVVLDEVRQKELLKYAGKNEAAQEIIKKKLL